MLKEEIVFVWLEAQIQNVQEKNNPAQINRMWEEMFKKRIICRNLSYTMNLG